MSQEKKLTKEEVADLGLEETQEKVNEEEMKMVAVKQDTLMKEKLVEVEKAVIRVQVVQARRNLMATNTPATTEDEDEVAVAGPSKFAATPWRTAAGGWHRPMTHEESERLMATDSGDLATDSGDSSEGASSSRPQPAEPKPAKKDDSEHPDQDKV